MTTVQLAAWILAALTNIAPPERYAEIPTYPEATETAEERHARYASIAWDVAEVAADTRSPKHTAALLLGIAYHESGFARDVDLGPCAPARLKKGGCDGGRAHSLWQIQAHELESRQHAARVALRLAYKSFRACKHLPTEERLAAYAAGTCSEAGRRKSRALYNLVKRFHM